MSTCFQKCIWIPSSEVLLKLPSSSPSPPPETGTCCIHGSTIWQISDGVAEFGPWQWRSWSVRVRSNGLRMVDGVAGPVHWRAIWQVASRLIDQNSKQQKKEQGKKSKKQWMKRKKVLTRNVDSPEQRYRWSHVICHIHLCEDFTSENLVIWFKQSLCTRFLTDTLANDLQIKQENRTSGFRTNETTLPKTNTAPARRPSQKETHLNQPQCFSCYVSFREGNTNLGLTKKSWWFLCQFQATDIIHELQISIGILLDSIGELNAVQGFPFLRTGHNEYWESSLLWWCKWNQWKLKIYGCFQKIVVPPSHSV